MKTYPGQIIAEIVTLRWNNQYQQALDLYKQKIHRSVNTQALLSEQKLIGAIIDCLRETGRAAEAVDMIEKVWKLNPETITDSRLQKNISWLYCNALDQKKTRLNAYSDNRSKIVKWLLNIQKQNNDHVLFGLLFFRYMAHLWQVVKPPDQRIGELFNCVSAGDLSTQCQVVDVESHKSGRKIEMASDREKWYMWLSKYLYSNAEYNKCIIKCKEALESINPMHHGNQHWLVRRIALSYKQMGDLRLAIHEFEKLIKQKSDWFIQKELAELYFLKGDLDLSINIAGKAMVNSGYNEFKAGLVEFIGKILTHKQQDRLAHEFYVLATAMRRAKNWPLSSELLKQTVSFGTFVATDSEKEFKRLLGEIAKQCTITDVAAKYHGTGLVTRILHEGNNGDGFITCHEGRSIYFRFCNARISWEMIKTGLSVSFMAKEVIHKEKKSWIAVKIFQQQ